MSPQQLEKTIENLLRALDLQSDQEPEFTRLRGELIKALIRLPQNAPAALRDLLEPARSKSKLELTQAIHKHLATSAQSFKDSQIPLLKGDGVREADPHYKARAAQIVMILDNLRSVFNVGSIFRSSECLSLGEIALCGITPGPEHPNLSKTAMDTQDKISHRRFADCSEAISYYRDRNYRIFALETAEGAISPFEAKPEPPLALIVGNESLGIGQETLALCDGILALPVLGWKNSLNVGVAFAVCTYQLVFGTSSSGD